MVYLYCKSVDKLNTVLTRRVYLVGCCVFSRSVVASWQ